MRRLPFRIAAPAGKGASTQTRLRPLLLLCVLHVPIAGCGGTMARGSMVGPHAFSADLGTATNTAVQREAPRILNAFGFEIEEADESGGQLWLRTSWQDRELGEDDVTGARTRLILTTRPRATTNSAMEPLTAVTLRSENIVLQRGESEWRSGAVGPELERYLDEIADAFRTAFRVRGLQS